MDVLILGGTGVISTSVVRLCVEKGYNVTCVNRGKSKNDNADLSITVFHCRVTNEPAMRGFLEGKFFDVAVDFLCYSAETLKLHMDYLRGHVKQLVLISTDSVYKVKKEDGIYSEDDERGNPIWKYSTGKIACEDFIKENHKEYGMEYTIVRPALTFGNTRIPYGLMPKEGYHYFLVERIKHNKSIPIWNGGQNISTIIRSEDFAKLFVPLLGNEKAYSEVFNVCGDEFVSNMDILKAVSDYAGKLINTVDVSVEEITNVFKDRVGEFAVDRAYDHKVMNTKVKTLTGVSLTMTVEEGLRQTLSYYENNDYCSGIDYFFDGQLDRLINETSEVTKKQRFVNYWGGS